MPAQGEQKEMFLVLENHSRIAEVGSKASQSYTEFKKRSQCKLFCSANKKIILYELWPDLGVSSKG